MHFFLLPFSHHQLIISIRLQYIIYRAKATAIHSNRRRTTANGTTDLKSIYFKAEYSNDKDNYCSSRELLDSIQHTFDIMMLLKSKKRSSPLTRDEALQETKEALVKEIFGSSDADFQAEMPPFEKIVVLLWLFRDDENVVQYLSRLIETVSNQKSKNSASNDRLLLHF